MSDLAKCIGHGCTVRETCWRYLAPASEWQAWILEQPGCDYRCRLYWPAHAGEDSEHIPNGEERQ